jgi:hypothetical protein
MGWRWIPEGSEERREEGGELGFCLDNWKGWVNVCVVY